MKKIITCSLFISLLLLTGRNSMAQTTMQVSRLATLGKLWGFLKYYHPDAAKGTPDWDKELLRMIPLVEGSPSRKAFDSLLDDWYHSLPPAQLSATPVDWEADSLVRIFTEKDIEKFSIADTLKAELARLYHFHLPGRSRYITRRYEQYYLDHIYHTEDPHNTPACPERPMRLLALFRYWNTINYLYPHKDRLPAWDHVLTNYIPRFLNVKDSAQYRIIVKELIHELPDAHSFFAPAGAYYFTPFRIDYIEGKYLIGQCDDSMAKKWDYRLGDEIIAVNGVPVLQRTRQLMKTVTGTNANSLYRNIAIELLKTGDSVVRISFKRNEKVLIRSVELHTWEVHNKIPRAPEKRLWQEQGRGIWYVRFCRITNPDTLNYLFSDIKEARAVIWDMRDYPSYPVTTKLGRYIFSEKTQLTEERTAYDVFPGTFIKSPLYYVPDTTTGLLYKGPMIVLVDEYTQSLSESIAAMLKLRSNTITMGRQTAGTTGNITWFTLPGGLSVSYTGVGVTGMMNSFRQGKGVKLDVPVALTRKKLIQSRDYILEQALEYARKNY